MKKCLANRCPINIPKMNEKGPGQKQLIHKWTEFRPPKNSVLRPGLKLEHIFEFPRRAC